MPKTKLKRIIITALAFALTGCASQSNVYQDNPSKRNEKMREIDWSYNQAFKVCEIFPRNDLRPDAKMGLSYRKGLLLFKRLKDLVAGMNNRDYVICETLCPGWETYDFIIVAENISKKGSMAYLGSEENIAELNSNAKFDALRKFIQESGVISIPPNLEHFSTDDGTYFFYVFHFDGQMHQTFCYAPTRYGRTSEFYTLHERLSSALVKHPNEN